MPRKFTDITVILDRSGSMDSIQEATIEGLNAFVEDQKKTPGDGCWSLIQFDDPWSALGANEEFPKVVFSGRPQSEMLPLTQKEFVPRGGTALVDAVCKTIDATGRRLQSMREEDRPDKVLFVIMTDGQENSSQVFTKAKLNEKISHQRSKYNWQFIFLGANQDAITEARGYGIPASGAMTYNANAVGTAHAYGSTSSATRGWKADGNPLAAPLLTPSSPDDPNMTNVTTPGSEP